MTEAIQDVLGGRARRASATRRARLCRRVAAALGRPQEELWFDYFGLNHLGWLRGVLDGDRDLLPDLLADDERLDSFEEGRLFGGEWLRSLGMIPNEYLYFYYFASDTVGALRDGGASRGEFLLHQQAAFYAGNGHTPAGGARRLARRPPRARPDVLRRGAHRGRASPVQPTTGRTSAATRRRRSRSCEAITGNEGRVLILDTANRSSLPFLDERAVVEVPCVVGRAGRDPDRGRRRAGPRARADRDDQGRRAHDDPRRARGLARARRARRSRCTRSSRP